MQRPEQSHSGQPHRSTAPHRTTHRTVGKQIPNLRVFLSPLTPETLDTVTMRRFLVVVLVAAVASTEIGVSVLGQEPAGVVGVTFADVVQELRALRADVAEVRADVAEVRADVAELRAELRADVAELRADVAELRADVAELRADVTEVRADVAELLGATVTPRAAAAVTLCARQSTLFLFYMQVNNTTKAEVCSAFAYAPSPGAAPVIVTAAHCLKHRAPGQNVSLEYFGGARALSCAVAFETPSPQDAAILECDGAAQLVGLAHATSAAAASQPVAITGFAEDTYRSMTPQHLNLSTFPRAALNVDFASVAGVAGPHFDAGGRVCASSAASDSEWNLSPGGYVDRRVTVGMSGGAVLDLSCGVVGIAHGRSCAAGVFASLEPIDTFLANRAATRA